MDASVPRAAIGETVAGRMRAKIDAVGGAGAYSAQIVRVKWKFVRTPPSRVYVVG
jgi:hypothetical protein